MHYQAPPLCHRDLKIENILLGQDKKWKICDFGSSTVATFPFVDSSNRYKVEEEIEKASTPLYRSPEMSDLYSGYPINEKADLWALGCIMYTLMFFKQPF